MIIFCCLPCLWTPKKSHSPFLLFLSWFSARFLRWASGKFYCRGDVRLCGWVENREQSARSIVAMSSNWVGGVVTLMQGKNGLSTKLILKTLHFPKSKILCKLAGLLLAQVFWPIPFPLRWMIHVVDFVVHMIAMLHPAQVSVVFSSICDTTLCE